MGPDHDWQDIAAGRRDGSQMLLYRERDGLPAATGTYWIGSWADGKWIEDTECREIHPTHCAVLVPPRRESARMN